MSKFILVAYKPNSYHDLCNRGCCGTATFDADFHLQFAETMEDLGKMLGEHIELNQKMDHGEDGFALFVFENNKLVFVEGTYDHSTDYEDENRDVFEMYYATLNQIKASIEEKRVAAEKLAQEEAAKKAKEFAQKQLEADRKKYEELKKKFEI